MPGAVQPKYWRAQVWRPGRNGGEARYGNSGGAKREIYKALAKEGLLIPTAPGTKSAQNHAWQSSQARERGQQMMAAKAKSAAKPKNWAGSWHAWHRR